MADRKISDLTALTTPASGDYVPIVDISEAAAASKNKRITIEELMRGMPDGTAAAPGVAFETDPNTGIYRPGADQLAVATNGTGRLFVASDGSVGIGQASDNSNYRLNIYNSSADFCAISIGNSVSGSGASNGLVLAQNQADSLFLNRENGYMSFSTNNTEKLRITSGGLVGVGTSSPTANLHVYGTNPTLSIEGDGISYYPQFDISGINGKLFLSTYFGPTITAANTAGTAPLVFRVGGTAAAGAFGGSEVARITSAGLVGIGTSAPVGLFELKGSSTNYASSAAVIFTDTNGGSTYNRWFVGNTNVNTPGDFVVASAPTPSSTTYSTRLLINASGNVGIGTTSPTTLLDVNADTVRVRTARTPASASATGATGEICWDANYIYVCTATNTWKRAALSTW